MKRLLLLMFLVTAMLISGCDTSELSIIPLDGENDFESLEKTDDSICYSLSDFNTNRDRPNIELETSFAPYSELYYVGSFEANCPQEYLYEGDKFTYIGESDSSGYYMFEYSVTKNTNNDGDIDFYPLPSACRYPDSGYIGVSIRNAEGCFYADDPNIQDEEPADDNYDETTADDSETGIDAKTATVSIGIVLAMVFVGLLMLGAGIIIFMRK